MARRLHEQRAPLLLRRALRAAEEFDIDPENEELARRYVIACKGLQGPFAALSQPLGPLSATTYSPNALQTLREAGPPSWGPAVHGSAARSPGAECGDSVLSSPPDTPETFVSAGSQSAGARCVETDTTSARRAGAGQIACAVLWS